MTLNEMIRKWNIVIVEQNGEKMLKAIGKFTPKQAEMVKAAKQEIIAELERRKQVHAEMKAKKEAEEAEERRAILAGEKSIQLMYHDGEYLSGWEVVGQSIDLMQDLGLCKYVDGWGYYVKPDTIAALGKEFTYQQAQEYARPILEEKTEKERKQAEARAAREKERASMKVEVLKQGKIDGGDGADFYADVKITDPTTGERARFTCRNIFDFGYVVNPAYAVAEGLEPGGIEREGHWMDLGENGWYNVRPLTEFEVRAVAYLHKFPPTTADIRM